MDDDVNIIDLAVQQGLFLSVKQKEGTAPFGNLNIEQVNQLLSGVSKGVKIGLHGMYSGSLTLDAGYPVWLLDIPAFDFGGRILSEWVESVADFEPDVIVAVNPALNMSSAFLSLYNKHNIPVVLLYGGKDHWLARKSE